MEAVCRYRWVAASARLAPNLRPGPRRGPSGDRWDAHLAKDLSKEGPAALG